MLTPSRREVYVHSRLQAIGRARRLSYELQVAAFPERAAYLNESLPNLLYRRGDAVMMLDRRCAWAPAGLTQNGMKRVGEIPSVSTVEDALLLVGAELYFWLDAKAMLNEAAFNSGEETPSVVGEEGDASWIFW